MDDVGCTATVQYDSLSLLKGALLSGTVYVTSAALHLFLPGSRVIGYACGDDPKRRQCALEYKLNGLLVTIFILLGVILLRSLPSAETSSPNFGERINSWAGALGGLYPYSLGCALGGTVWGLLGSVLFFVRGGIWCQANGESEMEPINCVTSDKKKPASRIRKRKRSIYTPSSFYRGIGEFNPRSKTWFGEMDYKMWLYVAGGVMLELQVLFAAGAQAMNNKQSISRAMGLTTLLWTWFVVEYMSNEHIHLYTYDLFAERLGFKLIWGCLGLYPFLYPIAQHFLVSRSLTDSDDLSLRMTLCVTILFYTGWTFTRFANYQKFIFKTRPEVSSICFGLIQQKKLTVKVNHGGTEVTEKHLLIGGFWGLARHINYLGEMLQGLALGLPAFLVTGSPLALLYFAFITCILVCRQWDDDELCRAKYGDKAWDEYTQLCPWRIIPLIY